MPVLKVLINKKGDVVGTMRTDATVTGKGSPELVNLVARPGQRIIEVNVDDKVARLDPAALHAAIKAQHLREPQKLHKPSAKAKR